MLEVSSRLFFKNVGLDQRRLVSFRHLKKVVLNFNNNKEISLLITLSLIVVYTAFGVAFFWSILQALNSSIEIIFFSRRRNPSISTMKLCTF